MNPLLEFAALQSRRGFLRNVGLSAGGIALTGLLGKEAGAASASNAPGNYGSKVHPSLSGFPHFKPRARRLIYLHMTGAPSQIDMWDYKPGLKTMFDKDLPDSVRMGQRITGMTTGQSRLPVAPSIFQFAQHGKSGMWVSELLPHTAKIVDEITLLKAVNTNAINHDPAWTFQFTGSEIPGKPGLGSWLSYGLGSKTKIFRHLS